MKGNHFRFATLAAAIVSSSAVLADDDTEFFPKGYNPENVSYSAVSLGIPLESAMKIVTSSSTALESFWRVSDVSDGIPIRTDKLRMFVIILK